MTQKHDKNQDGLDFLEMYAASGGRLQDLWIFNYSIIQQILYRIYYLKFSHFK